VVINLQLSLTRRRATGRSVYRPTATHRVYGITGVRLYMYVRDLA